MTRPLRPDSIAYEYVVGSATYQRIFTKIVLGEKLRKSERQFVDLVRSKNDGYPVPRALDPTAT